MNNKNSSTTRHYNTTLMPNINVDI